MRTARVAVLVGAQVAIALLSLTPAVASGTSTAADCPGPVGPVQVSTAPAIPGLPVVVGGRPVVLSPAGTATVTACRADLVSTTTVPTEPVALDDRRRARFDRMFVTGAGGSVALAFHIDYLTEVRLQGLPAEEITAVTLRSSTGERVTTTEPGPQWLWGQRVVRGPSGLQLRDIYYTVDEVRSHGVNVVNRSQTKFLPGQTPVVPVTLLTYQVDVQVRDRLFGFPIGTAVSLEAADGTVLGRPLASGDARLTSVPRGTYTATVDAPGLNTPRPVSISQNQTVDLPVLSYVDIGVIVGLPTLAAVALVLVPRPRLRAALRSRLLPARAHRRTGARTPPPAAAQPEADHLTTAALAEGLTTR